MTENDISDQVSNVLYYYFVLIVNILLSCILYCTNKMYSILFYSILLFIPLVMHWLQPILLIVI